MSINKELNETKINMVTNHSIAHDSKKRPERKICGIRQQDRCDKNVQGLSGIWKNTIRSDHCDHQQKTLSVTSGTHPSRQEQDIRCLHTKENCSDRMEREKKVVMKFDYETGTRRGRT